MVGCKCRLGLTIICLTGKQKELNTRIDIKLMTEGFKKQSH